MIGKTLPPLIIGLALAFGGPALATDGLDLAVGVKTLPLLVKKIASPSVMAVLFDGANPDSRQDADRILKAFQAGIEMPSGISLSIRLVPIEDLSRLSGVSVAFLTQGIAEAAMISLSGRLREEGILSMSTNLDCVKANLCVLGIVSRPNVEIYVSPQAAEASRIEFVRAFIMLAKPIRG